MFKTTLVFLAALIATVPATAQTAGGSAADIKASLTKHLKTSEEFTLKVAEAMPAENYDFKLTPEQMSFGGQMAHIAQALNFYSSNFTGEKPAMSKPASNSKADVTSFLKSTFDNVVAQVEKLTDEQMTKSYKGKSGYDLVLGMLDHTTNHRASAEMYLRVKGITPPKYEF
jgi:uncharacterized damage-inducible protein DinB